jgi:hypothetical protein
MIPDWLNTLAIVSLVLAGVTFAAIVIDVIRHPQPMAVMNITWPITALYFGPVAWWAYSRMGRPEQDRDNPFWMKVFVGVTHCGGGCTLGDIISEFAIFFTGFAVAGSMFATELGGDFLLAFLLGVAFQYFAIQPMRHLAPREAILLAVKADALSLIAFEVGLFAFMALMRFALFTPPLTPDQPAYWFMMQIGMVIGFATSYPMNWWLIRKGVKEAM